MPDRRSPRLRAGDLAQRGANDRERPLRVSESERRIDAHHAIAEPTQPFIPTPVRTAALAVRAAIHLHHEPHGRRKEVCDVAVPKRGPPFYILSMGAAGRREAAQPSASWIRGYAQPGETGTDVPEWTRNR